MTNDPDRARVLLALADEVERQEPSYVLEYDIGDALTPDGLPTPRPYMTSIDAAASAMPAGWRIWVLDQTDTGVAVTLHCPSAGGFLVVSAEAPTEPRARTAAALRAMAAEVGG